MSDKSKKARKRLLMGVILGIGGVAFGYFLAKGIPDVYMDALKPEGALEKSIFIFILLFSIWGIIALHELGHLLAGLAQGFKLMMYVVGPLGIRMGENEKPEVYLNKDFSLMGGVAGTLPQKSEPNLRKKLAKVVLAGPITSFVIGVLGLGIVGIFMPEGDLPTGQKILFQLCGMGGFMSMAIFLATTLPKRTGMFYSDRGRAVRLLRPGLAAEKEEAMMQITASVMSGHRYRDMTESWFETSLKEEPGEPNWAGEMYAYYYFLDTQDWDRAKEILPLLAKAVEETPTLTNFGLNAELVFGYAYLLKDLATAEALWNKTPEKLRKDENAMYVRAKAALAYVRGETEALEELIPNSFADLKTASWQNKDFEMDLLRLLVE